MKKITLFCFILFSSVFSWEAMAQYGCASGVVITDGYTATGITSPGNGGPEDWNNPNPSAMNMCTNSTGAALNPSYFDDDVYLFTYTAGPNSEEISMTINSLTTWTGIGIFASCSGTALDDCMGSSGSTTGGVLTATTTIEANQTVYIAVGQWGTPNAVNFNVTSFTATPLVDPPLCTTLSNPVNGSVTAPLTGNISWNTAAGGATDYNLVVGTTSGASDVFSGNVGNVTTYNVGALAENTEYFVTITPINSNGSATGCSEESFTTLSIPLNDECADAVALTVNADFSCGVITSGTTAGATDSGIEPTFTVAGTPNNDVWFSFVATSASHRVSLTNIAAVVGTAVDMGIAVFNGAGTCASLALVGSSDPNTYNVTGLTPGTTYYVAVYGFAEGAATAQATFDICVGTTPPPPANDNCDNAVALTVNADFACGVVTAGSTVSATDSGIEPTFTVSGTPNNDVWFSFVATSPNHRISLTSIVAVVGTTTDMGIAVFDGTGTCSSLALTGSSDPETYNVTGLTAGTTYYVAVYGWASGATTAQATFNICVGTPPPPPANDNFADAIALNCDDNVLGNTTFATIDENSAPDGFGADLDAPNVWYTYTGSGTPETITIDLCPSGYDTSFLVYTGTSGSLTLVGGNDDNEAQCGVDSVRSYGSFTSDGTTTYYITVEGWNSGSIGAFDLTLTCEPVCAPAQANQDCASASSITVSGTPVTVDNTCASVNAVQPTCDSFSSIADLWYTFVAPASGEVDIESTLGTATAAHMAVYSGSCGTLTSLGCNVDAEGSLSLTGLTPAQTYYLQLWNNGTEEGTFDVTLSDPTLSIDTLDTNGFTYYPNPVKNTLHLTAQSNIQSVSIFNMLGQEVVRTAPNNVNSTVDMSALQTGAYFVKVTINDRTETIRVIKN